MTQQTSLPWYDHRIGTGPTLVFLHYWGGSARTWDLVIDRLPERDTLAIDFRGWSHSAGLPGPYTLDQLAVDTLAVMNDAELTDYIIIGHSMGGKVAQLVASGQPTGLRGIVLVGSGPAKPPAEVTTAYREALSYAYDTPESVAHARDNILTATTLPESIQSQIATDSRASADAARTEWPLRGIAQDITEHTRNIRVPALVIAGENDRVEPVDVLKNNLVPYLTTADFTVLADTGHLMPLETPAGIADQLVLFLAGGQ